MTAELGGTPSEFHDSQGSQGPKGPGGESLAGPQPKGIPELLPVNPNDSTRQLMAPGIEAAGELGTQITRIVEASTKLLDEDPDWEKHDHTYVTSFGPRHSVRLHKTSTTNENVRPKKAKEAGVDLHNGDENLMVIRTKLDRAPGDLKYMFHETAFSRLPRHPEGVSVDVVSFVDKLVQLRGSRSASDLRDANALYDELIQNGEYAYTEGLWHRPKTGNSVYLYRRTSVGPNSWVHGLSEPVLQIRVPRTSGQIDFGLFSDGHFETAEERPEEPTNSIEVRFVELDDGSKHMVTFDSSTDAGSIVRGAEEFLKSTGDLGDTSTEDFISKLLGPATHRVVKKGHLDVVERGLEDALNARKIQ